MAAGRARTGHGPSGPLTATAGGGAAPESRTAPAAQAAPLRRVGCTGVPITCGSRQAAAREVVRLAGMRPRRAVAVHLCNAYTLALADRDPGLRAGLTPPALNFPDGKAVVWAIRALHPRGHLPSNRVYGPDLFLDVIDLGQDAGLRHYLLGSTPDVVTALAAQLRERFPRALVVGVDSPPFRELEPQERRAQADRIAATGADVVWVGLGTPKQDHEVTRLAAEVAAVHVAVGAAFDFVAGTKRQAPRWMREHGLEWLFRLLSEPRRLWRRYLFGNARFVWAVARRGRR